MKAWHVLLSALLIACASVIVRTEFTVAGSLGSNTTALLVASGLMLGLLVLTTLPEKR